MIELVPARWNLSAQLYGNPMVSCDVANETGGGAAGATTERECGWRVYCYWQQGMQAGSIDPEKCE